MKIEQIRLNGIKSYSDIKVERISNYNIFIGPNNSGKSNFLYAIRIFFEDQKITKDDIFKFTTVNEIRIEITFKKSQSEKLPNLGKFFKNKNNIVITCSIDTNAKSLKPIYRIDGNEISKQDKQELMDSVDLIYVPAVWTIEEEISNTKMSPFNKLMSDIIIDNIKNIKQYDSHKNFLNVIIKKIKNEKDGILDSIQEQLDSDMIYNSFNINICNPLNKDQLLEELVNYISKKLQLTAKINNEQFVIDSQGNGFQRSLLYSLIKFRNLKQSKSKKPSILLFEEPELFLHPNLQKNLRENLIGLSKKNFQIFITTHSPYFITNIENINNLNRVYLEKNMSYIKSITKKEFKKVINKNRIILENANIVELSTNKGDSSFKESLEKTVLLWSTAERMASLFSNKVLLVEGRSDVNAIYYLLNSDYFKSYSKNDLYVMDTNGKFTMYLWASILNSLGVQVWILYDQDGNIKKPTIDHMKLNKYIEELKTKGIIKNIMHFDDNIEKDLGFTKSSNTKAKAEYVTNDVHVYMKINEIYNDKTNEHHDKLLKIQNFLKEVLT